MFAPTNPDLKVCKNCRSAMRGAQIVCERVTDIVTGESAPCEQVRADEKMCGREGRLFSRRMNISALVDQAPIYGTRNGERTYLGGAGDPDVMPPVETPMATIRDQNDPDIQKRLAQGGAKGNQRLTKLKDYE